MNSSQKCKLVAACMIGNLLECYDFAIYGYFAVAIGRQFFPHQDPVAQLLSAFGAFAVGYLMRPLGGALVGHTGLAGAPRSPSPSWRWLYQPS
jgi:MHS family proline/betaine transporter-like MFS transporter